MSVNIALHLCLYKLKIPTPLHIPLIPLLAPFRNRPGRGFFHIRNSSIISTLKEDFMNVYSLPVKTLTLAVPAVLGLILCPAAGGFRVRA